MHTMLRRELLRSAAVLASGAGVSLAQVTSSPAAPAGERPVRLGGPVFAKTADPGELAAAHRKLRYAAAYCPPVELKDTARIRAIEAAYQKADVVIAEVGRWCNLMDADPARRAANLQTVTEGLALADEIGARCCVDIAGSFNPEMWFGPHPENLSPRFFEAAVENARKIIDAVKPRRAKFCYEMMGWALPDSPDSYAAMVRAVDRPAFGVHLDICNLVNSPRRFYENANLIRECFAKLGGWIASCHAKDLVWDVEMNVHFREVPAGAGKIDLAEYLRGVSRLGRDVPLMIEHCANEQEFDLARRNLLEIGEKAGIRFA